jgi:hypothetical protein
VEPGQPQDRQVHRRRPRRHGRRAGGGDLSDDDRLHLHYALGKAHEDAKRWAESFDHYAKGAAIRRTQVDYDPEETHADVARSQGGVHAGPAGGAGPGLPAPDPIFMVGLPRSGSTLVEQILASHSPGRGHDGAARPDRHGPAPGRQGQPRADSTYPECWPTCRPTT